MNTELIREIGFKKLLIQYKKDRHRPLKIIRRTLRGDVEYRITANRLVEIDAT